MKMVVFARVQIHGAIHQTLDHSQGSRLEFVSLNSHLNEVDDARQRRKLGEHGSCLLEFLRSRL